MTRTDFGISEAISQNVEWTTENPNHPQGLSTVDKENLGSRENLRNAQFVQFYSQEIPILKAFIYLINSLYFAFLALRQILYRFSAQHFLLW
jgi:hypothetical protein